MKKKKLLLHEYFWINRGKILAKDLATKLGITAPYISKIAGGKCIPSDDLLMRLEKETGGDVSAEAMMKFCQKMYTGKQKKTL